MTDEVLISFSFISVLIFDKIDLQWMNQYICNICNKVQFDFALEVWFSIYMQEFWNLLLIKGLQKNASQNVCLSHLLHIFAKIIEKCKYM